MFKALKLLNHEKHQNILVHNTDRTIVTKRQKMHKIIEEYFKKHFQKERRLTVQRHMSERKPLRQKFFCQRSETRMANNKASSKDNIPT